MALDLDPVIDGQLIGLDQLKDLYGVRRGDQAENDNLVTLSRMASYWLQNKLDRKLSSQVRTEYRDGNGWDFIPMRGWPIVTPLGASEGVWLDPLFAFGDDTKLVEDSDYRIRAESQDRGLIYRCGRRWERGAGIVKLVYTAGYDVSTPGALPDDLERALLELIGIFRSTDAGNTYANETVSLGGATANLIDKKIPPIVIELIQPYARLMHTV